jgi:Flp pilus assembly protein protease CpaA
MITKVKPKVRKRKAVKNVSLALSIAGVVVGLGLFLLGAFGRAGDFKSPEAAMVFGAMTVLFNVMGMLGRGK